MGEVSPSIIVARRAPPWGVWGAIEAPHLPVLGRGLRKYSLGGASPLASAGPLRGYTKGLAVVISAAGVWG